MDNCQKVNALVNATHQPICLYSARPEDNGLDAHAALCDYAHELAVKVDWALSYIAESMEGEHAAQLRYILDDDAWVACSGCKCKVPVGVAYCEKCSAARQEDT